MISVWPWMTARSASGQSTIGRIASVAGAARRRMPTRHRCRASTRAFVKCVVPIITAAIAAGGVFERFRTSSIAPTMPLPTSAVVGDLWLASTLRPRNNTASVFVPPTSTPIRSTSDINSPQQPQVRRDSLGAPPAGVNAGGE